MDLPNHPYPDSVRRDLIRLKEQLQERDQIGACDICGVGPNQPCFRLKPGVFHRRRLLERGPVILDSGDAAHRDLAHCTPPRFIGLEHML